jgi:hypothetical protein
VDLLLGIGLSTLSLDAGFLLGAWWGGMWSRSRCDELEDDQVNGEGNGDEPGQASP